MCNDNKGPTLRIFVGEMDLMPSARAVVTRSRTTKYMMDTSFEVAMAFCWCPMMPPTASHKIETTVLVTNPQLIDTLNHSLCLKISTKNTKHSALYIHAHTNQGKFLNHHKGPRTLQLKLQKKLLSSIHTTTFFPTATIFSTVFIDGQQFSQRFFWKIHSENHGSV